MARIAGREEAGLHEELERVLVVAALVEPEPALVQLVDVDHRVLRQAVDAVHLRGAAQVQCGEQRQCGGERMGSARTPSRLPIAKYTADANFNLRALQLARPVGAASFKFPERVHGFRPVF